MSLFLKSPLIRALRSFASTGLLAWTGSAIAARTITRGVGTHVANGSGASGNPAISLGNSGGALTDPGADGFVMWDDSDTGAETKYGTLGTGLAFSGATIVPANDLGAIEALSTVGVPRRTASETWAIIPIFYNSFGALADDTAGSFDITASRGGIGLLVTQQASFHAVFSWDSVGTYAIEALVEGTSGASIDFTTGALTGTTGTDGRITVSIHTDNKIYCENRLGGAFNISIYLFATAI